METLFPQLSEKDANQINMLALAHVGDAVYELLVRSMLCREKNAPVMQLHRLTVERVRAEAQAEAVQKALFGWLYLTGKTERIEALFTAITEE